MRDRRKESGKDKSSASLLLHCQQLVYHPLFKIACDPGGSARIIYDQTTRHILFSNICENEGFVSNQRETKQ